MIDAAGKLWVTDFGLARTGSDSGLTMTGDLLGTLRYMSPEQALARRLTVDHRTDIYSLGVTLYELLAGQPAVGGSSREEILKNIVFGEPRPLRRLSRAIPAELEIIVGKAMAQEPERRYSTARELAEDLRRFLEQRPIHARRMTIAQRVHSWARRHQAFVGAAASVLVIAVVSLAVSTGLIAAAYEEETNQREKAERQKELAWQAQLNEAQQKLAAEQERNVAERRLYNARIQLAWNAWQEGNSDIAEQRLAACVPAAGGRDFRAWEWYYLRGLINRAELTLDPRKAGKDGEIIDFRAEALAFSPDGHRLACVMEKTGGDGDNFLVIRNAHSGHEILCRPLAKGHTCAQCLEWSPNGDRLTLMGRQVLVWDIPSGNVIFQRDSESDDETCSASAWSADGKFLAVARGPIHWPFKNTTAVVEIWEPAVGKVTHTFKVPNTRVASLAWSPDGVRLAAVADGAGTDRIIFWDVPSEKRSDDIVTGFVTGSTEKHAGNLGLAWSADGKRIAWGASANGTPAIATWNVDSGKEVFRADVPRLFEFGGEDRAKNLGLVWTPDNRYFVVVDQSRLSFSPVVVLSAFTGQEVFRTSVSLISTTCSWLAVSPDGQYLATRSAYGSMKTWELASGRELAWIRGHAGHATALAWSADGKRLASGDSVGVVKVWNAAPEQHQDFLTVGGVPFKGSPQQKAPEGITQVAWAPDGKRLATSFCKTIGIWDVDRARKTHGLGDGGWSASQITWSPDGKYVAVPCSMPMVGKVHYVVKVWNPETGAEAQNIDLTLAGLQGASKVYFSPDSKQIAGVFLTDDGKFTTTELAMWDVASAQEVTPHQPRLRFGNGNSVVLSPDWQRYAVLTQDGNKPTLSVHEMAPGKAATPPKRMQKAFTKFAWSPDSTRLAGVVELGYGAAAQLRIWDVANGQESPTCQGSVVGTWIMDWSPDGRRIATQGTDGMVRIFDTIDGTELLSLPAPQLFGQGGLAWSPDGKRLAAGGGNEAARVWDSRPGY